MGNSITTEVTGGHELDHFLAQLPFELRQRILPKAQRANVREIQKAARSKLPQPGYPGDKDPSVSLRRNIVIRVKTYERHVVAIVGPTYATTHAHLVEFGHRLVRKINSLDGVELRGDGVPVQIGFVPPKSYMRSSIDETAESRHAALIRRIKKEVADFQNKELR